MSFYKFIINNKDAFDSEELNNYQLKTDIMKHPKIKKETNLSDVSVDTFIIENKNDVVYCNRVIMFNMVEKIYPVERFDFCYIPFIYKDDKKGNIKYYLLVKDMKTFFQSKASMFKTDILHIKNYKNVFVFAKTTSNNPTILDIIIKNYMVYKQIQDTECMKIISNMTSNMKYFINDVLKSENVNTRNFLKTPEFEEYRHKNNILLKQIAENDRLKYGIDYELGILDVYRMAEIDSEDIPDLYILKHAKKPIVKYNEYCVVEKDEIRNVHYCEVDDLYDPYGLYFHNVTPTKEWINFYDGIKFYQQPPFAHLKEPLIHTNSECDKNPELKKYLASIPSYKKTEDIEDSKPVEKSHRTIQNNIKIISSTNNNLLNIEPEFEEEKCNIQ